ncbi:hypothetical protein COBT_003565, partial [Conglomerata obtusa]
MFRFLVQCIQNNDQFIEKELLFLLKSRSKNYTLDKTDEQSLFILSCDIDVVDYIIERSIFIKFIAFLDIISVNELKIKLKNFIENSSNQEIKHLLKDKKPTNTIHDTYDNSNTKDRIEHSQLTYFQDYLLKLHKQEITTKIEVTKIKSHLSLEEKKVYIEKNKPAVIDTRTNLKTPDIIYQILITQSHTYKCFLYRLSNRKQMLKYDIRHRPLIGITCMDWEISIFMANICNVKKNEIVLDPFAGCGGILMACAYFDANVLGLEIDHKMIVGTNLRKGNVKTSLKGNNIFDNFKFIEKRENVIGIIVSDMFKIKFGILFDSII